MNEPVDCPARRQLLRNALRVSGALLAGGTLMVSGTARAKVAKSQMQYQTHPREGKSCASCRFFTPETDGAGTCALVEGAVSRDGWCVAYAPGNATY